MNILTTKRHHHRNKITIRLRIRTNMLMVIPTNQPCKTMTSMLRLIHTVIHMVIPTAIRTLHPSGHFAICHKFDKCCNPRRLWRTFPHGSVASP